MAGILILVFIAFLYPIWPFAFKYGVFKVTLYLLVFLVALQVIRFIVYVISRLLGYGFWILPNLNNDVMFHIKTLVIWNLRIIQAIIFKL